MKIAGVKLGVPSEQLLCFPRTDPETGEKYVIPIKARAVLDFKEFDELVPEVDLVIKTLPGGDKEEDLEDEDYMKASLERSNKRFHYMVVKGLLATEGLSWDKIKDRDPETWSLWEVEMASAGLTEMEIRRVNVLVMQVNSFDEDTLEDAKLNFLRRQAEAQAESLKK